MIHELKILRKHFVDVHAGRKSFEIRFNDRGFKVGDELWLFEIEDEPDENGNPTYTGRLIARRVTYMTDFQQQPGYVVMSIVEATE